MKKLIRSIDMAADCRTIWESIVDPLKYETWTRDFQEGSTYEGGWSTGDAIRFIAANDAGVVEGMFSEIAESRYPEFISIRHLGIIKDGLEDRTSDTAKAWTPAFENYRLEPLGEGAARFTVEMDVDDAYGDMFAAMWEKALVSLKAISEACYGRPMAITVRAFIPRSVEAVWEAYTVPAHITEWNFASEDWWCPKAENPLEPGGRFAFTMASRDGRMAFDFSGVYEEVVPHERIRSRLDDGRNLCIRFKAVPGGVAVEETFTAEGENTLELQRQGWQAILNRFAAYVEEKF